jgi:hypothetical protein
MHIILLLDPDTNVRLYVCLDPNMYEALIYIYIGIHGEVVDFKYYMHLLIASL